MSRRPDCKAASARARSRSACWLAAVLLIVLGCGQAAFAVERKYVFARVNADDDLVQNTVNAILQDRTGFIWVATQGGLHRYDGYRFIAFQHSPEDPRSLPDNFVTALAQDADGTLWIGTNAAGLARFDAARGQFITVSTGLPAALERAGAIGALLPDPGRGLWIGNHRGVSLLNAAGERQDLIVFDPATLPSPQVRGMARAADGSILVATTGGLWRIEPTLMEATRVASDQIGASLSVLSARDGSLWVGAVDGLHRLDAQLQPTLVWPRQTPAEEPTEVLALTQTPDGRIWAAILGGGLVVVDAAGSQLERLHSNPRVAGSLAEDSVRTLTVDRSGLLWIGGYVYGVSRVDPAGARFSFLLDDNPARRAVETNNTRSLLQDDQGRLVIGTEGDGLKRFDFRTGKFDYFLDILRAALPEKERVLDLRVFDVSRSKDGRWWLGSNRGAFVLDPGLAEAQLLSLPIEGAGNKPFVRAVTVARDGGVWLGTMAAGLLRFAPEDGTWTRFSRRAGAADSLWHNAVLTITEDRAGLIWIGTFDGLNVYDPASGKLRRMPRAGAGDDTQAGNLIRVIYQGADGALFIGSHDGLSQLISMDANTARFRRWLVGDGLPSGTVYGIVEDARGALWLSTNRGIVRFDRRTEEFRSYTLQDGLQGLEFNGGAHLKLADGRIAFGGQQGINLFDPVLIRDSDYAPRVVLTAVQTDQSWKALLDPEASSAIVLAPQQRLVGFEFAALDFAAPARNRFSYRLAGFDENWVELGTRRQVSFTNLEPGQYTLQVRASNRDLVMSAEQLALPLTVESEWWKSPPANIVYGLLAIIAVLSTLALQRRRLQRLQAHTHALNEREERLRVAIWGSGDEFWDWDIRRGVLFRIGADSLLGQSESETAISGDDWRKRSVHPEDLPQVERILAEHVTGQREYFQSEHRVKNAKGEYIWVLSRGKIVDRDENGQPLRVAGTARNITGSREAESDKRIAEEVIRSMGEAVTVTDLEYRFCSVNPAFTRITGYSETEIIGLNASILDCEKHDGTQTRKLRQILEENGHWSGEVWQRRKDGEEFLCSLEVSEVIDRQRQRVNWVGVMTDITDRKRAEQELRYLANYDTLTGLPNRAMLADRLGLALARARENSSRLAVLFLDLDRFKHVNDSMGHAAGDRLLKAAAARIQMSIQGTDTVARLGGDEFTVIVENLSTPAEAENVARGLLEAFMRPLDIDGRTQVVISTSIGISVYPDHGRSPSDLLKFADTAMYQAKERGRNTFQLYTEAMEAHARLHASMVTQLHQAIERREFSLVFQPKLGLADGRITGVEALLRWTNTELGEVSPAVFIALAEETGLIVPIGEWVLREACAHLRTWFAAGIQTITMAVNVSMLQLLRGELYTVMQRVLAEYDIPAGCLELELTESMVMANAEQSILTLSQIKTLGVQIAIDDFGTGYSSLAYLKRLPIDTLKIDKEFVGEITTDPDDEAITATIITMAHSMGLKVIAEGVETQGQLDFLRAHACDEAQGYLIARPLAAEPLLKLLLEHQSRLTAIEPNEQLDLPLAT